MLLRWQVSPSAESSLWWATYPMPGRRAWRWALSNPSLGWDRFFVQMTDAERVLALDELERLRRARRLGQLTQAFVAQVVELVCRRCAETARAPEPVEDRLPVFACAP